MVPLLIPIIVLGSFSFIITQGYIRNDIDNNTTKILNQAKENVELIFSELDSLSINFELNPSVTNWATDLLKGNPFTYESPFTLASVMNIINPPASSKPYIHSIYVYYKNKNKNFYLSNTGIVNIDKYIDKSWYKSFEDSKNKSNIWIEPRAIKMYSFEKKQTRFITLYKKLNTLGSKEASGVIVVNLKREYIDNILNGLISYTDQSFLIFDEKNKMIAGSDNKTVKTIDIAHITSKPENFFEFKSEKGSFMVNQTIKDRYGLKYISIIPSTSLYKVPIQLLYITITLLIISFILGMFISFYVTRHNYTNLKNIILAFESAEKGEPLPALPSRIKDEYSYIQQNIIKTFLEQSYLKVQLSEKKYMYKASQLIALQAQINPHFLFNTLKTIYWKSVALTGGQNEISGMIEDLSGILHYSLGNPEALVPLAEEIKNTQRYIGIQKIRYKDKFGVIWQYDEALTEFKVVKLLFQPFIENSIYHGIKEKEGSSYIKIKINRSESILKIAIIDTGLGIDTDTLSKIRTKLHEEGENSEHIGLFNTDKRLRLMYGEEYGIKLRSKQGLGTVVYISIPIDCESN